MTIGFADEVDACVVYPKRHERGLSDTENHMTLSFADRCLGRVLKSCAEVMRIAVTLLTT